MPDVGQLCAGLFDDASMFPPNAQNLADSLTAYCRHRVSSYGDTIGSLVSQAAWIPALNRLAITRGVPRLSATVVVPGDPRAVAPALALITGAERVVARAVDVRLEACPLPRAVEVLVPLIRPARSVYVEMGFTAITEAAVHRLAQTGLRLKLPIGATSLHHFVSESELARVLVICAAEGLALKCSAGVRRAVRHFDADSLQHRHGYLNIALAVRVAAATGSAAQTARTLSITDAAAVLDQVHELSDLDIAAARKMLSSVSSFDVAESVADLRRLGLLAL